jgi:hypothetical protein
MLFTSSGSSSTGKTIGGIRVLYFCSCWFSEGINRANEPVLSMRQFINHFH